MLELNLWICEWELIYTCVTKGWTGIGTIESIILILSSSTSPRSLKSVSLPSIIGWKGSSIHCLTLLSCAFLPHHFSSSRTCCVVILFAILDGLPGSIVSKQYYFPVMLLLPCWYYYFPCMVDWRTTSGEISQLHPPIWSACLTLGRYVALQWQCFICFRY